MASTMLTFVAILFFTVPSLSLSLSYDYQHIVEDEEEYVLDTPFVYGYGSGLRTKHLLATVYKIKKGAKCNTIGRNNICNGVYANNGAILLNCCKKHCRNVLGDRNNCGACGRKCGFGQRCCNGKCNDVLHNDNNCGKCGRKCARGVACQYGVCGYA